MFRLIVNDSTYTCPDESLVPFALVQAMDRGIVKGPIHDKQTAIEYLNSIGITVEEE